MSPWIIVFINKLPCPIILSLLNRTHYYNCFFFFILSSSYLFVFLFSSQSRSCNTTTRTRCYKNVQLYFAYNSVVFRTYFLVFRRSLLGYFTNLPLFPRRTVRHQQILVGPSMGFSSDSNSFFFFFQFLFSALSWLFHCKKLYSVPFY